MEVFPEPIVVAAATDAIRLGAISFDAVKQLVIAKVERRPATLDLGDYPYLPVASSVVPRGTSFHRSVELEFPPIAFDPPARLSHRCDLPGPAELGAVNPDAVHDHGQSTRQGHNRLFQLAVPGDLSPDLEPGPFCRTHQHDMGRFVEQCPHHLIPAPGLGRTDLIAHGLENW